MAAVFVSGERLLLTQVVWKRNTHNSATNCDHCDAVRKNGLYVDGDEAGAGASFSTFLRLGNHTVTAVLLTQIGLSAGDIANVLINDTIRPMTFAEFMHASTGQVITQVNKGRKIKLRVGADNICDPAPVVQTVKCRRMSLLLFRMVIHLLHYLVKNGDPPAMLGRHP